MPSSSLNLFGSRGGRVASIRIELAMAMIEGDGTAAHEPNGFALIELIKSWLIQAQLM